MAQVLDYSAGKPGAAAIKRAGYIGAVRYIGFPTRTKCTDAGELADFTRHGLGMALVYQDGRGDALGGYSGGVAAAGRAGKHADAIGFPSGRPIYFAVDQDIVTDAQMRAVREYLRGAGSVLGTGRVGVYGERDVTVAARTQGVASWFWQTRAWSGTPVRLDPERHLYQRPGQIYVGGIQCDVNDVLKADWGQHTKEDDMPSPKDWADADWDAVEKHAGKGVWTHELLDPNDKKRKDAGLMQRYNYARVSRLALALPDLLDDDEKLAALVDQLTEAIRQELADSDIEIAQDVVERGVRNVLGSLKEATA